MPTLRSTLLLMCVAFVIHAESVTFSGVALSMPLSPANLDLVAEPVDTPADASSFALPDGLGSDDMFRNWLVSDAAAQIVVEPNFVEDSPIDWSSEDPIELEPAALAALTVSLGAFSLVLRRRMHNRQPRMGLTRTLRG